MCFSVSLVLFLSWLRILFSKLSLSPNVLFPDHLFHFSQGTEGRGTLALLLGTLLFVLVLENWGLLFFLLIYDLKRE